MIVKGTYNIVSGVGPRLGTKLAVHAASADFAGWEEQHAICLDGNGGAFLP